METDSSIPSRWQELFDESSNLPYYWNSVTNETKWDKPASFKNQTSYMTLDEKVKIKDCLTDMGYPGDLIEIALEGSFDADTSIDDITVRIAELQAWGIGNNDDIKGGAILSSPQSYLRQFLNDYQSSGYGISSPKAKAVSDAASDFMSKLAVAANIINTFDDDDPSSGIIELLSWAKGMKDLEADVLSSYNQNIHYHRDDKRMQPGYKETLFDKLQALENQRQHIEQDSIAANVLSDKEIQRMAELDGIAAGGSEEQQLLHSLLSRSDAVAREIKGMQQKMNLMVATDRGVTKESLEELYYFLAEQVANGKDLEAMVEDLHETVYNLVPSNKADEVLRLVLDLQLCEDEQKLLNKRIHECADDLESPPQAEANGLQMQGMGEGGEGGEKGEEVSDRVVSATAAGDRSGDSEASAKAASAALKEVEDARNKERLDSMKAGHKDALLNLQRLMEEQRHKKLKALEDKLVRKRLALSESASDKDEKLQAVLEKEVAAIESDIDAATQKLDVMSAGITSGFKKKCLSELQALKRIRENRPLTVEELRECNRDAAEALKKRFEKNQLSLLDSLELKRSKSRDKLLQKLAGKKRTILQSGTSATETATRLKSEELATLAELETMNKEFDDQESEALARGQEDSMLALSAIFVDTSLLQSSGNEEDYLDDQAFSKRGLAWLDAVQEMKSAYEGAALQLQKNLQTAHHYSLSREEAYAVTNVQPENSEGNSSESLGLAVDEAYGGITVHMMKVITEAFTNQLTDLVASGRSSRSDGKEENERVKNNILSEFEKARAGYQESIETARLHTKAKLQNRIGNRDAKGEKSSLPERETDKEQNLDDVIAIFLEDPTKSTPVTRTVRKKTARNDEQNKLDAQRIIEDNKEQEKQLAEDLQVMMKEKKKALEDRLNKKRQQKKDAEASKPSVAPAESSEQSEDAEEGKLEAAAAHLTTLLHQAGQESSLRHIGAEELREAMERILRGEPFSSSLLVSTGAGEAPLGSLGLREGEVRYSLKTMQEIKTKQQEEDKRLLEEEMRQKTSTYNEEQQKHELMMKIQQARQRQSLQRKLFEKKQAKNKK